MGLFSSKTKTYVGSTVYNLAGENYDRPNYLKTMIVQTALSSTSSAGLAIRNGIFRGPNQDQKAFFKWTKKNYTLSNIRGVVTSTKLSDPSVLVPYLPTMPANSTGWVQEAHMGIPDPDYWADRHLANNYPQYVLEEYNAEMDNLTKEVTITFVNEEIPSISFMANDFDNKSTYIMAKYFVVTPGSTGSYNLVGSASGIPSIEAVPLNGAREVSQENLETLSISISGARKEEKIYRDLRPNEVVETPLSEQVSVTRTRVTYVNELFMGYLPNSSTSYNELHRFVVTSSYSAIPLFTRNVEHFDDYYVITTVDYKEVVPNYEYDHYIARKTLETYSNPKVFIYRIGTNIPELDTLIENQETSTEYFPMLPMRINNRFIDSNGWEDLYYNPVEKAFKKGFHSKLDDFLDDLKDNESINDLDFIYLMYGISINESDNAAKKYIFEFFSYMSKYSRTTKTDFDNYIKNLNTAQKKADTHNSAIMNAYGGLLKNTQPTPQAPKPVYPSPEYTQLTMNSSSRGLGDYNVKTSWMYIHETIHAGKSKPNVAKGEVWFSESESKSGTLRSTQNVSNLFNGFLRNNQDRPSMVQSPGLGTVGGVVLYYQDRELGYRRLEITGLQQDNYVYAGKSVSILANDGLRDSEESGFIIPLHYPTLTKLSLVDQNQFAMCNKVLLINSYVQKKRRWYQRGIFKVLFAIAAIVISVVTMNPVVAANTMGLLGTNAAVGAALGFGAGAMAGVIAGAVVNGMAAMLLTTVITQVSAKLFGAKWGQLIGSVLAFVGMNVGMQFQQTGSFNWSFMTRADTLMKITEVISQGHNVFVGIKMENLAEEMQKMSEENKAKIEELERKYRELYGDSGVLFDYTMFMDMNDGTVYDASESLDSFTTRTLLTGQDIAQISMDMITDFAEINLALPNTFN